jgi:Phage Tail Collar Domain
MATQGFRPQRHVARQCHSDFALERQCVGGLPSVSGEFIIVNNCTGNFSVTVKSSVPSTRTVTVPAGLPASLWCDVSGFVFYASEISGTPPGAVMDFAGPTAPPGWLFCFGQSILRAQYPALFNAISTTYGSVDGAHFNVPDYRGRIIAGSTIWADRRPIESHPAAVASTVRPWARPAAISCCNRTATRIR